MARALVRPVRVDRSTAGAITVGLAVISCCIVFVGPTLGCSRYSKM
jgi:hypothetical protein